MLFERQMGVECFLFKEARQAQQDNYHVISPYTWNLKKNIEQVEILETGDFFFVCFLFFVF